MPSLSGVQPGEQRHPLLKRFREVQLALHRQLGDRGDLRLEAGIISQLVDAFLADDRRIHVGDQQPFAAVQGRLNDNIDAFPAF